ncbi:MAG: type II toxin-antitoxin system RelE/ParE family toxin [Saprospiraceae bacterium]|nr:type II toxin-antitoxin system RelE/ParE family toxin [Saprospiraceae bacterium]
MKFDYEISILALKDLDQIWEYTAKQWSIQQANKYYKEIFQFIGKICKNYQFGKSIDEIKKGHRRLNIKSHMIIYKTPVNKIFIDRIFHQNINIDTLLNE